MSRMAIRPLDPERDADACIELLRASAPHTVTSRAAWLHRVRSLPERTKLANFVAEADGRVVGESYGLLALFGDDSIAICNVTVAVTHRRRGIGTALLGAVEASFDTKLLARFPENRAGVSFATSHGFHAVRAESESVLDVTRFEGRPSPGVDLRAVSETDPRHAHLVDLEATRDMPSTEEIEDLPYDEWAELVLGYPLFAAEGSFVAYAGDEPAAVSLLVADLETGRSSNWFTGTRREFRGRGLATAVKVASIAWARDHGVVEMVTDNDERNAGMLAINRRLGFRPAGRRVEYLREGTASSPARQAPAR
jgi:ribosomal protein S18 acetylase RimI-like enzyme